VGDWRIHFHSTLNGVVTELYMDYKAVEWRIDGEQDLIVYDSPGNVISVYHRKIWTRVYRLGPDGLASNQTTYRA
jgi:hypothetical protein